MNIIIVDDEPTIVSGLKEALSAHGHEVWTAVNGKEAFELFSQNIENYDLLISDIKMPVMDGLTLLKQLQQLEPELPVVLITGYSEMELALQALRLGAIDFILKPMRLKTLFAVVDKVEQRKKAGLNYVKILPFVEPVCIRMPSYVNLSEGVISYFINHLKPLLKEFRISTHEISIVLNEALMNAIIHGNLEISSKVKEESFEQFESLLEERQATPEYAEKTVEIRCELQKDSIVFQLTDQGKGFSFDEYKDLELTNLLMLSGRGLVLIRSFMDEVKWEEPGNRIIMKKMLPN